MLSPKAQSLRYINQRGGKMSVNTRRYIYSENVENPKKVPKHWGAFCVYIVGAKHTGVPRPVEKR